VTIAALVAIGIRSSIVLTMVGLGLTARRGDATSLFRDPAMLTLALIVMMVIVPILAVIAAHTFELEPAVTIAIVALSVSPVPPLWVNKTRQLKGGESYTIGLLVASSVLAIPLIPIELAIAEGIFSIPLSMPLTKVAELTLGLSLLPLALGIGLARVRPRVANRLAVPVSRAGLVLLVVCAVPILVKFWSDLTSLVGDGTMLAMAAFSAVGLLAGHVLGGPADEERAVLALAAASRHPGIAIALATTNFPDQKLVPAAVVLYLLVSAVVCFSYSRWHRHHMHRERPQRAPLAVIR